MSVSLVKAPAESFSTIALSPRPRTSAAETVRRHPARPRGLDGTGKISKDMAMTATPRIDARWSCVDQGLRGG
jgi:hypothetical protein